jgi:hypothetical protein
MANFPVTPARGEVRFLAVTAYSSAQQAALTHVPARFNVTSAIAANAGKAARPNEGAERHLHLRSQLAVISRDQSFAQVLNSTSIELFTDCTPSPNACKICRILKEVTGQ